MTSLGERIKYSPSAMDNYMNCPARSWYEWHPDDGPVLPTDPVPAAVSSALHDALMDYHREVEAGYLAGHLLDPVAAKAALKRHIERALFRSRVDDSMPTVAERLKKARPGLDRIAVEIAEGIRDWVRDGTDLLVWTEAALDHGPSIRAVELSDVVLVPTRPDVIGLRSLGGKRAQAVVRDYKVKSSVVDPAFDNGILVRALWALSELQNPRCRWFINGRNLEVNSDIVELETVNMMFATTEDFIVRRPLSAARLSEHRARLVDLALQMADTGACEEADVTASPNYLCYQWCPQLHRCQVGQAFVRKYRGEEALAERLSEL